VRQEYAHDRRNKKILLTTKGYELRDKLQPLLLEIYTSASEDLEEKSLEEMIMFLQKINYEFKKLNSCLFLGAFIMHVTLLRAQDTHLLGVDELFTQGIENSLNLKTDKINKEIATQEINVAKTGMLPDISVDLADGYLGKVTVFTEGLTKPVYPSVPNWSQSYSIGLSQPIYAGGKSSEI